MIKVLKDLFMTFNQLSPNNCVFSISYGSNEACATVIGRPIQYFIWGEGLKFRNLVRKTHKTEYINVSCTRSIDKSENGTGAEQFGKIVKGRDLQIVKISNIPRPDKSTIISDNRDV